VAFVTRNPERTAPTARLSDAELPDHDTGSPLWPARIVAVGGVDVAVRRTEPLGVDAAGAPEPALFVHGLGGASTNWTDLAGLLRGRLDIEAIDLPGHGRSGPAADGDYSQPALARTVIGYLEQSGRGPVHLVGNSMGGAVSLRVASTRPDLVRTLTLISPAVPDVRKLRAHPLKHDPRMAVMIFPGLGEAVMRRFSRIAVEARVRATLDVCFADISRYPDARLAQDIAESRERMGKPWANEAFLRSMRGLARVQFLQSRAAWSAMRSITAPTLVLWGDTDRLVAADLAGFVAAAIPDSRQLVLENVGHTAMMEDPRTTARAILALIEDAADPAV
jgi:pimeloyl-ACP methyl ester carboxylesterase